MSSVMMNLPDGRRLDLLTQHGADAFLRYNPTRDGFLAGNVRRHLDVVRSQLAHTSTNNLPAALRKRAHPAVHDHVRDVLCDGRQCLPFRL